MEKLQIKDDITEEMILNLVNYFDTWVLPKWMKESRLWQLYWRVRARGTKIDKAEEMLEPLRKKKQEEYKWKMLGEMRRWIEDIKNNMQWEWSDRYDLANVKERADWRTMQLGIMYTNDDNKLRRKNSVVIEERQNPEFFEEMLKKYKPQERKDLYENKPF